jgi:putative DNA-invertase from lambdoid prophage Rac
LSRLGRSTSEVIHTVDFLLGRGVRVIVKKQNLDFKKHDMTTKVMVTLLSLFAELERDMICLRTKEALAAKKAKGIPLGKPKGTLQASMFDADREQIEQLLKLGLSGRKIAKVLKYDNPHGLNKYIRTRGLKATSE